MIGNLINQMLRDIKNLYQDRSDWSAREPRNKGTLHNPKRITIHHTVTPNNESDMSARVRQIQNWHMDHNGWADIGYHFLVGQDGRVYEGRPMSIVGAHVRGSNTDNIGIAVIGNFTNDEPTGIQLRTLKALISAICKMHYIKAVNISGHRDYHSKNTCPGDKLYNKIPEIIEYVR